MSDIPANELKIKGISAVEAALENDSEAVISVRGKPRFVVMAIKEFERLREAEIFAAWKEGRLAESNGEYVVESAEEHIARLERETAKNAV